VKLLIAYDSWDGHCAVVARYLADGAVAAGAAALLKPVGEIVRADFQGLDGLVTGSPVHQRGMSWPMKKFIDEICEPAWFHDELVGRVGGVFSTGGGHGDAGGGCELAQLSMLANLAACGCVLVPFAKTARGFDVAGMHWGPHVRITTPDMAPLAPEALPAEALEGAFHHGAAIARVGHALKAQAARGPLFDGGARFPSPELRAHRAAMGGTNVAQDGPR
jgi:NAD(P)H dehydrogenase (quinone)